MIGAYHPHNSHVDEQQIDLRGEAQLRRSRERY